MCQYYTGSVAEGAGSIAPESIDVKRGQYSQESWHVDRMGGQTHIYRITHDLGRSVDIYLYSTFQSPFVSENPGAPLFVYHKKVRLLSQDLNSFIVEGSASNNSGQSPDNYESSCPFAFVVIVSDGSPPMPPNNVQV
tara:strand:+ start:149 stop:559 length:411 start_codon:yes stop_codon:yes gene_type:complete